MLTRAFSRTHCRTTIFFSLSSFWTSNVTVSSSTLARVSEGDPSMGFTSATFSTLTPRLGKVLNKERLALPSSISHWTYWGAYWFRILVSLSGEAIIATAMPAAIMTIPKAEASVMPAIL